MRYASAAAFRRALETRLLALSRDGGMSLVRLRKSVAFDRLLASERLDIKTVKRADEAVHLQRLFGVSYGMMLLHLLEAKLTRLSPSGRGWRQRTTPRYRPRPAPTPSAA